MKKYLLNAILNCLHLRGLTTGSMNVDVAWSSHSNSCVLKKLRISLLIILSFFFLIQGHATPIPASEVFIPKIQKIMPNSFELEWQIKDGYFLYKDRIHLEKKDNSVFELGLLNLPHALIKKDKLGNSYSIYRNNLALTVNVLGQQPGEELLTLSYQGCSNSGYCYPKETKIIKISIDDKLALNGVHFEESQAATENAPANNSQNDVAKLYQTHHWSISLLIFYGFGLLLSFTPCILPMVPVLSGIIIGHGESVTTKKAFFLSLSYVLSMSLTYAIIGAVVALLGENLQVNMQSPYAIGLFSALFVLLALSMFGYYEFKLPDSWQTKIAGSAKSGRSGHYLGAALMGSLSTLILSPCVTAPLIGVLSYIAQTHNIILGSVSLFVLSLGMGTPLLLIGTSAGKLLPKSGSWMDTVKAFFGVLLLGVAIYLLERIIPANISMYLWALLLIFSGIYTGALNHAPTNAMKFWQGSGIVLLVYGLLILIGASMGNENPLQPLAPISNAYSQTASTNQSLQPRTLQEIQEAIANAKGHPVMLDFYADWCVSCKVLEHTVFKESAVISALADFTVLKIDVTENSANNKEIMQHYQVIAPPAFIFFDREGNSLEHLKLFGEVSSTELLQSLKKS